MSQAAKHSSIPSSDEDSELGQYIPLHYHFQMLLDEARVVGFAKAIEHAVPAGGRVLELGGGTGIMSYFASKKASQVYCVERNPELADAAKKFLALNNAKNVQVISADASQYVPDEPVDVVICEMLHSALLREKQTVVLSAFHKNYQAKFGNLPLFIPGATILAAQPVQQSFSFYGYKAPVPMFFAAGLENTETTELGGPHTYSTFEYTKPLPQHFVCNTEMGIDRDGELNAIRFITKNVLAFLLEEQKSIDWYNLYMIIPLKEPLAVKKFDKIKIGFSYPAGGSISSLTESLTVKRS